MKNFKVMIIALWAMLGFSACEHDHDCGDYDHSADLVGTWTCLTANYAEALIINANGSAVSTGVEDGEMWKDVPGEIVVKNGEITMIFKDNDNFKGHFDIIPGESFSIYTDEGERYTYQYCKEDLSEEVVGMWVCTTGPMVEQGDMSIQTYTEDGKLVVTTATASADGSTILNKQDIYWVIGDLLIFKILEKNMSAPQYVATRLIYTPNGTSLGDILTQTMYIATDNGLFETKSSWLRVKEDLDLAGKKYDYSKIFVTNVKGLDKDIEFGGQILNFNTLNGNAMDKFMKNILFNISFEDGKMAYHCYYNNKLVPVEAPIEVEGNKISIKMSANKSIYRDIVLYAFQDADDCQLHMYMPTSSFEKFIANIAVVMRAKSGKLDVNDAEAVSAIYNGVENAIETINVSFVMEAAK